MDFDAFKKFITVIDTKPKDSGFSDQEKRILARTVKLSEELGELSNEVLMRHDNQRKEKLKNHNMNNLPEEFADVIITTFLLAKAMGVDIEKGLERKVEKINKRFNI